MAHGGKREGSGRKKKPPAPPSKDFAAQVLARIGAKKEWRITKLADVHSDEDYAIFLISDEKVGGHYFEKLREKRDGSPVRNLNHMHDKPIEHNVTVTMAEVVRGVRERKEAYERSRN